MYLVYFENSHGERRVIGAAFSRSGADMVISDFLNDHNYTAYYWRVTENENETFIDVGSWSEFFYIRNTFSICSWFNN